MNPVGVIITAALFAAGVLTLVFARQAADANRKLLESASTRSSLQAAERSTPTQMRIVGGGALLMSLMSFLYGILPHLLD